MRYAQGGGLTDERRAFRQKLRMEAAERFRHGDENAVIAHDLRISVRSVQRRRKAWSQGGPRALASKGPASLPLLSDDLFTVLERELLKGPVAHGWPDQTWTLFRIKTLIGRRFHKSYTVQGVAALLKRHGWLAIDKMWALQPPQSRSDTPPEEVSDVTESLKQLDHALRLAVLHGPSKIAPSAARLYFEAQKEFLEVGRLLVDNVGDGRTAQAIHPGNVPNQAARLQLRSAFVGEAMRATGADVDA